MKARAEYTGIPEILDPHDFQKKSLEQEPNFFIDNRFNIGPQDLLLRNLEMLRYDLYFRGEIYNPA
jgi:hypothetical protein